MVKAYNGNKPYVFVSYSHKDWAKISFFIKKLQDNLCHVWFDEGIQSGSVWNEDLAEHLLKSEVVLLFLSPSSVESEFVKSEINFARNHNKNMLPVYLEPVDLPIGLEFQLSTIQAIHLYKYSEDEKVRKIINCLPEMVFLHTEAPFYIGKSYSFYLKSRTTSVPAGVNDKEICEFYISRIKNDTPDNEEVLFHYAPTPAYGDEAKYTVTLCNKISDNYFGEQENGIIVFNVNASFLLAYPLSGPDFSALMTFVIVNPEGNVSATKLVDCKISTTDHDYALNLGFDALKKELWGSGTELTKLEKSLI